jgi:2-polyprenyl-6-methoxyphenol hydroxylase-like FAD-dependent oxidoreductase
MHISIIGGGIAGLTTALALRQIGVRVSVYEASPEPKPLGAGIALAANAVKAFELLGIREHVLASGQPFESFAILDRRGRVITQTDHFATVEKYHVLGSFSIHRADLQRILLERLGGVPLHRGRACVGVAQTTEHVTLRFGDGSTETADYVIAADGIHSAIRRQLVPEWALRYAGYTCWRGVTGAVPGLVDSRRATETWAPEGRFGIVPLRDGRVYWFACLNAEQAPDRIASDARYREFTKTDLLDVFGGLHVPVAELLRRTPDERILHHDILDFKPLKRLAFGRVLLLGDAAHAMTPNLGQDACQGIEDAVVLQHLACQYPDDWGRVFRRFERLRLPRTTTLVNRSYALGKIAQLRNPWLVALRNAAFRLTPASVTNRQIDFLMELPEFAE